MPNKKAISPADIMPMADYGEVRAARRAEMTAVKRSRRVEVGPFATFYFENYETMWMQVHEMLFIEGGGDDQVPGELEAYNPLIPQGAELIATFMLEIADPARRDTELLKLGGVEMTISLEVGGETVRAVPVEPDDVRTTPEGKTSSVHFMRFPFAPGQVDAFRAEGARVVLSIGHPAYAHMAVLPEPVRAALAADFD